MAVGKAITDKVLGEDAIQARIARSQSKILKGRQLAMEGEGEIRAKKAKRKESRLITGDGDANAKDVSLLFDQLMGDYYPTVPTGKFDVKELHLAKTLLNTYKADLVTRVIKWMFEEWDAIREENKGASLGPVPTIGVLYGWRKKWFAKHAIETAKEKDALVSEPTKKSSFWLP